MSTKINITRDQLTAITAPIPMEPEKRSGMWADIERVSADNNFAERKARLVARMELVVRQCCACSHFAGSEDAEPCLTCKELSKWETK